MLVEQVEALKSIQETYVAMNSEQLNEAATFSKPKGFVNITKDEHDAILKKRIAHEKEHGTKNHREALSKRDTLTNTTSTFVSNGGGQVSHGLPEIVKIEDTKKGTTKYYRQPAGGHVKEDLDEKFAHPNHKKLDANDNGKVDAHDFELLRKKKGIKNFKEFKESLELDEAHKIGNKVTIHKGTGAGITGHIGEISRKFKGDTDPTYTIFHGDNQAVTVSKKQIKAVKD